MTKTGAYFCSVVLAAVLSNCVGEQKPRESIQVIVTVNDSASNPVAGASVITAGREVGVSDSSGRAIFRLEPQAGKGPSVEAHCPKGYERVEDGPLLVPADTLKDLEGKTLPVRLAVVCAKMEVEHVLVVRADGRAEIPVMVAGKERCRTDSRGIAQLVVSGPPKREVKVVLNTDENPDLRPSNPSRLMKLPLTSRFLVFDQKFEVKKKKRKGKRKKKRHAGPRRL